MNKSLQCLYRTALSVVILSVGFVSMVSSAQANLLVNGSFEAVDASASPYYIRNFASTPGWTQYGDGVDLIHNTYAQHPAVLVTASDGVQYLDMNQAGLLGGIYQAVAATAGVTYRLSLDGAAWATNSVGGTLGYELYDPGTNAVLAMGTYTDSISDSSWMQLSLSAAAISNRIGVKIYGVAATQAGMGLDNVVLQAIPEPETYALMLVGVGLVGVAVKKHRSKLM